MGTKTRTFSKVVPVIGKGYDRRFIYEWMYDNSNSMGIIVYPQRKVAEILDINYQHICQVYSDLEYVGFLKKWGTDKFEVVHDPYEDDIWEDFEKTQAKIKKRHQKIYEHRIRE